MLTNNLRELLTVAESSYCWTGQPPERGCAAICISEIPAPRSERRPSANPAKTRLSRLDSRMRMQPPHYHLVWQKLSGGLPEMPCAVGLLIQVPACCVLVVPDGDIVVCGEGRMGQMSRVGRQGTSSRLARAYCSRTEVCVWRATPAWMKQPKG